MVGVLLVAQLNTILRTGRLVLPFQVPGLFGRRTNLTRRIILNGRQWLRTRIIMRYLWSQSIIRHDLRKEQPRISRRVPSPSPHLGAFLHPQTPLARGATTLATHESLASVHSAARSNTLNGIVGLLITGSSTRVRSRYASRARGNERAYVGSELSAHWAPRLGWCFRSQSIHPIEISRGRSWE